MRWTFAVWTVALTIGRIFAADGDGRLANLSSRTIVGSDAAMLVAGLVIGGSEPKDILIRAVRPTLGAAGVKDALPHPRLELYGPNGQLLASNDQWSASLQETFAQVGASAFPANSLDAALRITLPPGNYTTQVSGVGKSDGGHAIDSFQKRHVYAATFRKAEEMLYFLVLIK